MYECIEKNFQEDFKKAMNEVEGQGEVARLLRECQLVDEMYWFHKFAPDITVCHDTNLMIGLPDKYLKDGKPNSTDTINSNNFNMPSDKMPDGKSIFVDYGKDFTLTPEGLAYVQANIKGFNLIDTSLTTVPQPLTATLCLRRSFPPVSLSQRILTTRRKLRWSPMAIPPLASHIPLLFCQMIAYNYLRKHKA